MKYSFMTTSMVFEILGGLEKSGDKENAKKEYRQMLEMISKLGIPAVDITSLELEVFGLDEVKRLLKETGLEVGGVVHMDRFACTDEMQTKMIVRSAEQRIEDACDLGSDNVMLALMAQEDVEQYSEEELRNSLVRNIAPIAEYGKKRGIKVSVEDTPDIRLPLCDQRDTKMLLDMIPELYLTYDSGNMLLKKDDPIAYYEAFQERICHVHLKDMQYTTDNALADVDIDGKRIQAVIHGQGMVDFQRIFKCMEKTGYKGYAMIEYVGSGEHEVNIRQALEALKAAEGASTC